MSTLEDTAKLGRSESVAVPQVMLGVLWIALGLWSWSRFGPTWIAAMRPPSTEIVDFYQEWGSARNYWCGLPVYTPHSTSIPRYLGLPSNPKPTMEYNIHPPTSLLLALPLGHLNYPDAVLVWNVISLIALLASLMIVLAVLPVPRALLLPGLAMLPYCVPVYGNLQLGQINIVLGLFVTAIWALERSGRSQAAGAMLGLAAVLKLFPAYLALYYLAQGRVRPLFAALISALGLTIITALILGLDAYHDYIGIVLPWNADFRAFGYNLSIAGLWHKLFNPLAESEKIVPLWRSLALARWGSFCSILVLTLILVVFIRKARTHSQRDLAFATTVVAMLLASPVTWDVSLLLLLVPITVIGCHIGNIQQNGISAALALILLIVWLPQSALEQLLTNGRPMEVFRPSFLLGVASIKFYALLGTVALSLIVLSAELRNHGRVACDGAVGP